MASRLHNRTAQTSHSSPLTNEATNPVPTALHGPYHGMAVSEEEYWQTYYDLADGSYEWNNGMLEEKPVSDYMRATMYAWFLTTLRMYLEVYPVAKMLFLEIGFRLPLPTKTTIRKPDLFVVLNDNPVPIHDTDRTYAGICDLCVESLSDSTQEEVERDTISKKYEYAQVGVREYYILDTGEEMNFYRLNAQGNYVPLPRSADGIVRSTVLPGFQFRISDLHRMPSLIEMADDPVYRHFALLAYQAQKQRAEFAEERADAAEERAAQAEKEVSAERERAERLQARLLELGITLDE